MHLPYPLNIPPQPRRTKSAANWLPWLIVGGALITGMLMLAVSVGALGLFYLSQERIPSGVTVSGIEVGGRTVAEAVEIINEAFAGQLITAADGARTWNVTLADLGVGIDTESTIQAAKQAHSNAQVSLRYTIDLNQTQNGLIALSSYVNIAAIPGTPPQIGRAIEIPVVLDRLRVDVSGELSDGVLDLAMIEVEPPEPEPEPVVQYTGPTTTHVVERGQELALIAREYGVAMDDIVALNGITNPDLIYVGQELTIPAAGVYQPSADNAPPAPTQSGKAIVISVGEQRMYAYENGRLIRSHLVSTGRSETPTVLGDYRIYVKFVADDMSGPDYFLPQVPYVMYFYRGYGIHGTYWHNSFGRPMSHGCVNLPVDEARWWFNWAEVGTLVRVIA